MNVDIELLPCPFCKSNKVQLMSLDWRQGVRCTSCQAQGPKIKIGHNCASSDEPSLRWNEYAINVVEIKKNINKNQNKKLIA